jgi:signal transduction histidine kinase
MEFVGTSSHYNGEVIINIKDRGTGIDIDMDDKIFSKFATKSDTGSGLGCFTYKKYC